MDAKLKQSFLSLAIFVVILSMGIIVSHDVYATISSATETPTKLNATAISPTQITLTWLPPTQNYGKVIIGYKIEKMIGDGVFDTIVPNTANTFPTYSVTGLETGTTYTYRVSAVYSDDTSTDPSNWASATPKTTTHVVQIPTTSSTQETNEKFDFTPADGTTLYNVVLTQTDYQQLLAKKEQRSIISGIMQTSQNINSDLNNVLVYQDNHQTSYTVPAPLIATATSPTEITLSWLAPEETYGGVIIGYKIEWKQANGVYVPVEDNTKDTDTKYVIDGLSTDATYTYRVSAIYSRDTISNPSNEASATPLASLQPITNATQTGQKTPSSLQVKNNTLSASTPSPTPIQQTNVEFDFIAADGTMLNGIVMTQAEYQQLIIIKDPRDIISNVTMTSSSINNDLSGILRYQNLHIPAVQQSPQTNITQPSQNSATSPAPTVGLDYRVVEGIIISVISSGAVGIITWLVKTNVTKKIAKEYHFTIEKFILDASTHIRIRNSGQTIEDCTILCDKQVCVWTDTNLDKPRHILEGSIAVARIPIDIIQGSNQLITIKSGKKILRKSYLDNMSHG